MMRLPKTITMLILLVSNVKVPEAPKAIFQLGAVCARYSKQTVLMASPSIMTWDLTTNSSLPSMTWIVTIVVGICT